MAGFAPRSLLLGIRTPGTRCCNTRRGSSLVSHHRYAPSTRNTGHRGASVRILWLARHTVEVPEELDPVRHLAREPPEDETALLDRQLDEVTRSSLRPRASIPHPDARTFLTQWTLRALRRYSASHSR